MAKIKLVPQKIDVALALASLKELGVTPENEKPATLAKALDAYYKKNTPETKLTVCDVCGVASSLDLDKCPGCGTGDDEEGDAIDDSEEDDSGEGVAEVVSEEDSDSEEDSEDSAESGDAPKKRGRKPKTALVEVLPEGVTIEALDTAVSEIKGLTGEAIASYHDLGCKIAEIHEKNLWKARRDASDPNKPAYKNFEKFCAAELGFSHAHAYNLMDVSRKFTREQVKALGVSKLALVLKAPEEKQQEILAQAEGGASKRELEAKVQETRTEAKAEGRDLTAEKTEKTGRQNNGPGKGREKSNVTVQSLLGKKQITLFRKPGKGESATVPARSLDDLPVGALDLENGLVLAVQIVKLPSGDLALKADFKKKDLQTLNPG